MLTFWIGIVFPCCLFGVGLGGCFASNRDLFVALLLYNLVSHGALQVPQLVVNFVH